MLNNEYSSQSSVIGAMSSVKEEMVMYCRVPVECRCQVQIVVLSKLRSIVAELAIEY